MSMDLDWIYAAARIALAWDFGLCHMHLTEQSINLDDAALPGASETPCSAPARAGSAAHARASVQPTLGTRFGRALWQR